ncbi:hypothetical protein, partial [Salmonella sp. s51228]|uniref:hypothetical protein n=1 Tax=Salmonella sp. s51228 TaxID=3159652 RepID=UPI00398016FE
ACRGTNDIENLYNDKFSTNSDFFFAYSSHHGYKSFSNKETGGILFEALQLCLFDSARITTDPSKHVIDMVQLIERANEFIWSKYNFKDASINNKQPIFNINIETSLRKRKTIRVASWSK